MTGSDNILKHRLDPSSLGNGQVTGNYGYYRSEALSYTDLLQGTSLSEDSGYVDFSIVRNNYGDELGDDASDTMSLNIPAKTSDLNVADGFPLTRLFYYSEPRGGAGEGSTGPQDPGGAAGLIQIDGEWEGMGTSDNTYWQQNGGPSHACPCAPTGSGSASGSVSGTASQSGSTSESGTASPSIHGSGTASPSPSVHGSGSASPSGSSSDLIKCPYYLL